MFDRVDQDRAPQAAAAPGPGVANPPGGSPGAAAGARPLGIALSGVTKRFGATAAVDNVSIDVAASEFFAVLGPSGCGKSTLLRLIAGLENADAGTIALGGRQVSGPGLHVAPERRRTAVVFQSYALWPHMSVHDNALFAVDTRLAKAERRARADAALATVSLEGLAERRPAALSGGQQQRVALARCLASEAGTVLMDEPLANLDVHLRAAMEREVAAFHKASGATTLYITHDQREAMALANRIAVMDRGRVLQVAAPETLYARPANETVARFIGRGAVLDGLRAAGGAVTVGEAGVPLPVEMHDGVRAGPGPVRILVRPEHVRLGAGPFTAHVMRCTFRGSEYEVSLALEPGGAQLEATSQAAIGPGERLAVAVEHAFVLAPDRAAPAATAAAPTGSAATGDEPVARDGAAA